MNLKSTRLLIPVLAALFCAQPLFAQFQYINPKPNSTMHHIQTGIILRNGNLIDSTSLLPSLFTVVGSLSGTHGLKIILSDDGETIVLQPFPFFTRGETVTVTVSDGIKTTTGQTITGTTFTFKVNDTGNPQQIARMAEAVRSARAEDFPQQTPPTTTIDDWKHGLPPFAIWTNTNPTSGQIFFHNFSFSQTGTSHYCIIQNNGDSVYGIYDTVKGNNFNLNNNGYLTVYNDTLMAYQELDSNYNSIDTFRMGNGYKADVHEFQIYPNGHSLMVCYDAEPFDMTIYNSSYNPDAIVTGAVIQELDKHKNVVFEWRSWDNFKVTDDTHDPLTTSSIDYVHCNTVIFDTDNNIIISSRHMDEVTKIDHTTGNMIWRWGGKNNQFTFVGDNDKFSHQHDVVRIANNHITMFDNGNYHFPQQSYAKEYSLDETNKIATLVWKYSRNTDQGNVYGNAMGSVQRLSNGNTLIDWGLIYKPDYPTATELDSNNNVVWEMRLDDTYDDAIYRIHRFTWSPCSRPTTSMMKVQNIKTTSAVLSWNFSTNASGYVVNYRKQGATKWTAKNSAIPVKLIKKLSPGTTYEWKVRSTCSSLATNSNFTGIKTFVTLSGKDGEVLTPDLENEVFIYPSPNHGTFQITLSLDEDSPAQIYIYDITGRVAYALNQNLKAGDVSLPVNLGTTPPGLYLVEVTTNEGKAVKKIIVE